MLVKLKVLEAMFYYYVASIFIGYYIPILVN